MKQKDLALIGVVVFVSVVVSVVVSQQIFSKPASRRQQAEVVQPISDSFPEPSERYFNKTSLDPTKVITISPNNNNQPFSGNDH